MLQFINVIIARPAVGSLLKCIDFSLILRDLADQI